MTGIEVRVSDIELRLRYQNTAAAILRTTTRPRDEGGPAVKPLFTSAEMDEMDIAYNMGLSAAGFAARLVARDKAPHGLCGNLTCRRPLPAIQPYPGYCNAGCCRERFGS